VMAISIISISSNSSEEIADTAASQVIMIGSILTPIPNTTLVVIPPTPTDITPTPAEIPTTIPTAPSPPDYTPASPDYSPASDTESDPSKDPSPAHTPPVLATSPVLSPDDDTTDSDTPNTPPSYTHDTSFIKITHRSPIRPRRRVMLLAAGQPIPYGRPYRYHLNGSVHMMTIRKRVGPVPVQQIVARHSLSDHSSPDLLSTSAGPSSKRCRSPMTSVPALPYVPGALSPVRADLMPSPKRVRDSGYLADVEMDPRETSVRDDVVFRGSDKSRLRQDVDLEVQMEIDEYVTYADALRTDGVDARVVVEAMDCEEVEAGARAPVEVIVEKGTPQVIPDDISEPAQEGVVEVRYETLGDLVQRFHDHTQAILVHRVQAVEGVQREHGHRIVGVESIVADLTERVVELEQANRRLRDTLDVESQRVARSQQRERRVRRELRQIRRFRFYDRARIASLEALLCFILVAYCIIAMSWLDVIMKMTNTRSGATMNRETVNEMIESRGNGNGGGNNNGNHNGNGNGDEGRNGNNTGGAMPVAKECSYQEFLKCQPLNFNGTEGVVGLTRWFEKMETVFHISKCPPKYQVKYATCTLLNSALTWWNSHKRAIGIENAYAMEWTELMKLMTEVYCLRNEI
ncbi:hypothetical protein Tco_0960609, partial [Tanacetum coccineum]